jgi:hypothetical protein
LGSPVESKPKGAAAGADKLMQASVQKPINEITFDHIYNLIENPMPCC